MPSTNVPKERAVVGYASQLVELEVQSAGVALHITHTGQVLNVDPSLKYLRALRHNFHSGKLFSQGLVVWAERLFKSYLKSQAPK